MVHRFSTNVVTELNVLYNNHNSKMKTLLLTTALYLKQNPNLIFYMSKPRQQSV